MPKPPLSSRLDAVGVGAVSDSSAMAVAEAELDVLRKLGEKRNRSHPQVWGSHPQVWGMEMDSTWTSSFR